MKNKPTLDVTVLKKILEIQTEICSISREMEIIKERLDDASCALTGFDDADQYEICLNKKEDV